MSHGKDKNKSRENRREVRELFMREWDPIGVAQVPEAADEYDAYASEAYVLLMDQDATAAQISAYLFEIASVHMSLGNPPGLREDCDRTAHMLLSMKPAFLSQ